MKEIERKFLVSDESFVAMATSHNRIAQGYLAARRVTARVRVYGDKAYITFKGKSKDGGLSRFEFEREIPVRCAELLLTRCSGTVEKLRYLVPYKGYTWEVDLFTGKNKGLVIAEVEMASESDSPPLPEWIWTEVTSDFHYRNSYLAQKPYTEWFK
jgi:CYTH domain-containing protein